MMICQTTFYLALGRVGLWFRHNDNLIRVGKIEHGPGALVEHVGIEIFRTHQRDVAIQALAQRTEPLELAVQCFDFGLQACPRLETEVTDEHVVTEIAEQPQTDERHARLTNRHKLTRLLCP